MIKLKRRLKIITLKFRKAILSNFSSQPDKNYLNIQKKAELIILSLINNQQTEIYIHNDILYLKKNRLLVRFDHENAHITNGNYSYYIYLGEYFSRKIRKRYNERIKEIVSNFDLNNDLNTINNLNKILQNI